MKSATVLSLGLAQLALAKSIHRVAPVRREPQVGLGGGVNSVIASAIEIAELQRLFGLNPGFGTSINFLWFNPGGNAATTILNQVQTVTVTVNGAGPTLAAGVPVGGLQPLPGAGGIPPAGGLQPLGQPIANDPNQVLASPVQGVGASPVAGAPGFGTTHTVTVGGPQRFSFDPQFLRPAPGDTLIFTFLNTNHTVTQAEFDRPCEPLAGGMDSGFQPNVDNLVNPPPQVAMQVMVDTPLWFYCRTGNHCRRGMVFSVNPTDERSHASFQTLAIQGGLNGNQTAIVGGPAAAPVAAPPAAVPGVPDASLPVANQPAATLPNGALASGVVTGVGTIVDGQCQCSVSCAFDPNSAFPAAGQGAGAFGGIPGGLAMDAAGVLPPVRR